MPVQIRALVALHELTETLTHQENVMQTLKNRFNSQARQSYQDMLALWWLLFQLIAIYRRLERENAPKARVTYRL